MFECPLQHRSQIVILAFHPLQPDYLLRTLEVAYEATAPVGTFLEITATMDAGDGAAHAAARAEGRLVATARGTFV